MIVKIHGAVDGNVADYRRRENYVIAEDDYIDYLGERPIESLASGADPGLSLAQG